MYSNAYKFCPFGYLIQSKHGFNGPYVITNEVFHKTERIAKIIQFKL
jgi:hypothetical protein